jgi:hypothetical protein
MIVEITLAASAFTGCPHVTVPRLSEDRKVTHHQPHPMHTRTGEPTEIRDDIYATVFPPGFRSPIDRRRLG